MIVKQALMICLTTSFLSLTVFSVSAQNYDTNDYNQNDGHYRQNSADYRGDLEPYYSEYDPEPTRIYPVERGSSGNPIPRDPEFQSRGRPAYPSEYGQHHPYNYQNPNMNYPD